MVCVFFFFFKQKTAYEMRISDWSSDVCSSDLAREDRLDQRERHAELRREFGKVGAQISRLVDQRDELPRDDRLDAGEAFADLREQMVVERAVMLGKAVEIDILAAPRQADIVARAIVVDRKSTRLNSSH